VHSTVSTTQLSFWRRLFAFGAASITQLLIEWGKGNRNALFTVNFTRNFTGPALAPWRH